MRVNMVVRGDEWISSVPLHHQLFEALDLPPVEYAHIAPLMKLDGKSRRKLSKRKDPEAGVDFYIAHGYPQAGVLHYLRSLANGRLAEMPWRIALTEPIRLEECNAAGPLVDLAKLGSMCREVVGDMSAEEVYGHLLTWARDNDAETLGLLQDEQYARAVLDVERSGTDRVRKDMAAWSEFVSLYGFFFPSRFALVTDAADERFNGLDPDLVRSVARTFADRYEPRPEADAWFEQVRETAGTLGFAGSVKDFKASPDQYVGSIRDVATVLRVLITGASRSPDLFEVCGVLGEAEVVRRVRAVAG
jgi:glutamyl-tRNA synthetase